jgi:beta-galactosidase
MGAAGAFGLNPAEICLAGGLPMETKTPGPVSTVQRHNGLPAFFLDGKPYTKPVFETYVPQLRFFQQFADAGCDIYSFSTNLGEGFSSPVWIGPDQWDFTMLDTLARRALEADPDGLLLPRILISTPDWWMAQNLQESQILAHGSRSYTPGSRRGARVYPSVASEKWRRDMAAGVKRLVQHIQQSDYGAHIFGYMVQGLMTEEWYHWSIHTNELSDYSPHMVRAFRNWLRRRYRANEALRASWNDSGVTFETAAIPLQEHRQRDRHKTFRDPRSDMSVIDYYHFYNAIIPETIDHFCRAVKEACSRKKAVGAFYAYLFEFGGDPEFGHNALSRLMQSRHLDFVMVTASYGDRALGSGADYMRSPITTPSLHGKLWYHDNDTVSFRFWEMHRKPTVWMPDPQQEGVRLGATRTLQETLWQYRRSAGFVLGHGVYQSFFDLHGGYYDDPGILEEIRRLYRLFDEAKQHDRSSCAEILVVSDEESCAYPVFEAPLNGQTLQPSQVVMTKIGAPHDSILVDDLERMDTSRHRLVIFLNAYHLSDRQRRFIRRKLLGGGRTVLWCYAPGFFNREKASAEAMEALTGIRIVPSAEEAYIAPRIALTTTEHPLTARWREAGLLEFGPGSRFCKLFSVQDPEAVVLGTLPGTETATLAMKPMRGWNSLYAITPVLPPAFYRGLAQFAGAHLYNDRDDPFYLSRSYLTLNAHTPDRAPCVFRAPAVSMIPSPVSGWRMASGNTPAHCRRRRLCWCASSTCSHLKSRSCRCSRPAASRRCAIRSR